ncbi:MAG: D-alanine--D-alanine ligase [Patescibacteria group bacterium]
MKKIKIALLAGGISGEREVSIKTGEQIVKALDKNKYFVYQYDPKTDLKQFFLDAYAKKFDLVIPALHGPFGEDGKLQGMLDMLNIPYLFSGTLASALAMNKEKTKIIAKEVGLKIIPDIDINRGERFDYQQIRRKLGFPIVIKPAELGSSVGMSIAKTLKELKAGFNKAFRHDKKIMLEKYIKGRELTVGIMGNEQKTKALPVIEIIPKVASWFDYRAKYEVGGSEEICPARIPSRIKLKIQLDALKIFKAIGCRDLARADFIWQGSNIYFLEINTIPGMTATSLVPQAAKAVGLNFTKFLDKLISNSLKNINK